MTHPDNKHENNSWSKRASWVAGVSVSSVVSACAIADFCINHPTQRDNVYNAVRDCIVSYKFWSLVLTCALLASVIAAWRYKRALESMQYERDNMFDAQNGLGNKAGEQQIEIGGLKNKNNALETERNAIGAANAALLAEILTLREENLLVPRMKNSSDLVLEHLHLMAVVLKNLLRETLKIVNANSDLKIGYMREIEREFRDKKLPFKDSLTPSSYAFGNAFREMLIAIDSTLQKMSREVNKDLQRNEKGHPADAINYVGVHFCDPCVDFTTPQVGRKRLYYESGSRRGEGLANRFMEEKGPPILDLVDLQGWCPTSSIIIHLTTGDKHPEDSVAPDNFLLISVIQIDRALPHWNSWGTKLAREEWWAIRDSKELEGKKTEVVDKLTANIRIRFPKNWRDQRRKNAADHQMMFFDIHKEYDHYNIIAANATVNGLNELTPDGLPELTEFELDKKILSYDGKNLLMLPGCDSRVSDPKAMSVFGEKLLDCFYNGLASISVQEMKHAQQEFVRHASHAAKGPDQQRFIYYTIPGSTKGRTAAGFWITENCLDTKAVAEVEALLFPIGLTVVDCLICLREEYIEDARKKMLDSYASQIMARSYEIKINGHLVK